MSTKQQNERSDVLHASKMKRKPVRCAGTGSIMENASIIRFTDCATALFYRGLINNKKAAATPTDRHHMSNESETKLCCNEKKRR